MSLIDRREIFQTVKALRKGQAFTLAEVHLLDAAIDRALANVTPQFGLPPATRTVSKRGIALMQQFEGCKLEAYPDPGSKDGRPWTIGYGATGDGIAKGVKWTQQQCDQRFAEDVAKFAAKVDAMLGDAPTTPHQFDAMVSLAFNIGLGAFQRSTVLRKHRAGDHKGAADAFSMWVKNDGKLMRGLVRRRLAEADLYDDA